MTSPQAPTRWLFLRGLSREQAHWQAFIDRCSEELGWDCRALDLPGFGSEHRRLSPTRIHAIRADLQQRHPFGDKPFGIIALSLGGMVALDWQRAAPEQIVKCVLINSSSRDCPFYHRLKIASLWPVIRSLGSSSVKVQERHILQLVSNRHSVADDVLEQYCQIRHRHPLRKINVVRQLLAAAAFSSPSASALPTPPLLISSTADRMVSSRCSDFLAKKYSSQHIKHASGGHDLVLDEPEWLLRQFSLVLS